MKSKSTFINAIIFTISVLTIVIFNSCAVIPVLEDGRSLGNDNSEVMVALTNSVSTYVITNEIQGDLVPLRSLHLGYKYGLTERLDASFRTNGSALMAGLKYQVVGDRSSKFAAGIGFDYSLSGFVFPGFNKSSTQSFQFPIYSSYHPSEKLAFYFNPRVINFRSKSTTTFDRPILGINEFKTDNSNTRLGLNAGVLYGSKNKIGLDLGYIDGFINLSVGYKRLIIKNK